MPSGFKISLLTFESQANQFALLEASTIKRFVVVATPHANSIATIIEPDDGYAHEFYVNPPDTVPWLNRRFPDAKSVLSKRGLAW